MKWKTPKPMEVRFDGQLQITGSSDTGRTLHTDGGAWRLLEADGQLFKSGVF